MRIHVVLIAPLVCLTTLATADVSVTLTTTPNGGPYAPANVVSVWIEDQAGAFVKTIDRHAGTRRQHLVAWTQKAGTNDVDAVSGATRSNHNTPITATWDLRDKAGNLVPDGTYTLRMELADQNSNQVAQNHQGTFTFAKGTAPQTQTGLASGGFTNVSIDFQPVVDTCNNGAVDAGETCDPSVSGSCPATCAASGDACMPNNLVGNPASCTAECTVQPLTACADGDGCCPDGCEASDSDCGEGGGADPGEDIQGGCDAGGGSGLVGFVALGFVMFFRRRRAA